MDSHTLRKQAGCSRPVSTFTARCHVLCILSLAYDYSMATSTVALTLCQKKLKTRWFTIWTPLSRHTRFPPKSDQRRHKHVSQCGFLSDQFHKLHLHLHLKLRWPYYGCVVCQRTLPHTLLLLQCRRRPPQPWTGGQTKDSSVSGEHRKESLVEVSGVRRAATLLKSWITFL